MRVLVTGAYGLIGAACLVGLHREGHEVIGAGRHIGDAARRFPFARWRVADFGDLVTAEAWKPLIADVDAVVNCVGVLQDGMRDSVRRVQLDATAALFEGCAAAGVSRVIHVSAIGADAAATTEFARTKAAADKRLAALDLDWAILRPGLVIAPQAYGGTALLRALAAFPLLVPVVHAESRIQVVNVDDIVRTVVRCLAPEAPRRVCWDLAHEQALTLAEIVAALRQWLGFAPARIVSVPAVLGRLAARLADAIGWLGWRSPMRTTALAQLGTGVVGNPAPWIAALGRPPASLVDILAAHPAGVQERWFARLYLLKPIAIVGLALFWIATGLITLGPSRAAAAAIFTGVGVSPTAAVALAVAGAVVDIIVGTAVMFRTAARAAVIGMLMVTAFYVFAATLLMPGLWLDPLGPLVKALPVALACLFTLAILDER
jgi:uncharacterized protein YbjT (DUF2867 family)